jgi:hypothetical protein
MRFAALERAVDDNDACEIAKVSFWDARQNAQRYRVLVYIVSCVVAAFLIAGIVLVALGSDTQGAGIVSFVGSVVGGAGMLFVIRRSKEAAKERDAAARLVKKYCSAETLGQLEAEPVPSDA